MLELLVELSRDRPAALCRLVETRGSTPQKAGAAMVVFADGSQRGTLGGGCVEAEVKRRALQIIERGQAEIALYQLDHDYGFDDGLICGGRMHVLIDPLASDATWNYLAAVRAAATAGGGFTEAVVFDEIKPASSAAACYLIDARGELVASLRGARIAAEPGESALPEAISAGLRPLASRPRPYAAAGVGYLTSLPRCGLLIVGGGHVGQAVAALAADLDFDVWVVDDRPQYVSRDRFPRADRLFVGPIGTTLQDLPITANMYCIIVTRGHNHDEEALRRLVDRGARYVGMIGSRRKIKLIFDDLLADGVSSESLATVYAPLGIDIGSQTVAEIAISIAAELVAHRNCDGAVPGRPEPVSLEAP
jgi:xanthine dehydrogenase accessory factor